MNSVEEYKIYKSFKLKKNIKNINNAHQLLNDQLRSDSNTLYDVEIKFQEANRNTVKLQGTTN